MKGNQAIPESAVDAAWDILLERGRAGSLDYAALAAALEAAAPFIAAQALEEAALDFEISPHNPRGKMARHFNNAYVCKLRERAEEATR